MTRRKTVPETLDEAVKTQAAITPIERTLLGAVLCAPDAGLPPLHPEDFALDKHRRLWTVLLDLAQGQGRPDMLLVSYELKRLGILGELGGQAWLAELMEEASTAGQVNHYAEAVRDAARERQLRGALLHLAGQERVDEEQVRAKMADLPPMLNRQPFDPIATWNEVRAAWTRERLLTGIAALDDLTGGHVAGEAVVTGGKTSHGKTAFACHVARAVAEKGVRVEILTLEDPPHAIMARLVSNMSEVPLKRVRLGSMSLDEHARTQEAAERLEQLPLTITGTDALKNLSGDSVLAYARRSTAGLFVLDHVQKVQTNERAQRTYGLERVIDGLTEIGVRDRKVMWLNCQFNREMDGRDDHHPQLSDLRDSAALENAARQVLLLYWPIKYDRKAKAEEYEIIVGKNTSGGTGRISCRFDAARGRFA